MKVNKLIKFTRYFINIIVITAFMLGTAGSGLASASALTPAAADSLHAAPVQPGSLKLGLEPGELLGLAEYAMSATGAPKARFQISASGKLGIITSPHLQSAFTDCSAVTEIPAGECEALVALYNATTGASWTNSTGWLATDTPCSWYGVTCDTDHVSELSLDGNNLFGPIPIEIGNLTYLTTLNMNMNYNPGEGTGGLTSSIPSELTQFQNLQHLSLYGNQLTGSIPDQISQLTNLTFLSLWGNQLSGSIPVSLTTIPNLTSIDLSLNQLTGSIPGEFGNMTSLQNLRLDHNNLNGSIPPSLGGIATLDSLALQNNSFTGNVPAEFGQLMNLTHLYINANPSMTGILPMELANLTLLSTFEYADTGLCAPLDGSFQYWLENIVLLTQNTTCPSPAVPVLTSPDDGSTVNTSNPTFSWGEVSGAVEYEFAIAEEPMFDPPPQSYTIPTTSITPPVFLANSTYYWRVRACGDGGYCSEWSTARSVIIAENQEVWSVSYSLPITDIRALTVYNGDLYAGGSDGMENGRIYRYDGVSWVDLNFSTVIATTVDMVESMQVFDGKLFIGTRVYIEDVPLVQIYRYDGSNFYLDFSDNGDESFSGIEDLAIHNNTLYAAKGSPGGNVYQRIGDNDWISVGNAIDENSQVRSLASFQGDLYASTSTEVNLGQGWQAILWKWTGSEWSLVKNITTELNSNVDGMCSLVPLNNKLYASSCGPASPAPIYTYDGLDWSLSHLIYGASYTRMSLVNNLLWAGVNIGRVFVFEEGTTWSGMGSVGIDNVFDFAAYGDNIYAGTLGGIRYRSVSSTYVSAPGLISPEDGSTVTTSTPTFSWGAVTDAVDYEFALDDDPAFGSPEQLLSVSPTETTVEKTPSEALANGTYYWRVRVKDSADYWSDWSSSRSVIINAPNLGFCSSVTELPVSECEALVTLYSYTDGANWTNNTGWLVTDTPCSWYGVTCDSGHVTRLVLDEDNLSGPIPSELANLTNLITLSLYNNGYTGPSGLTGTIPASIYTLANLQYFYLWGNQLTGSIPPEVSGLTSLKNIDLSLNQLTGSIPGEFGTLPNLWAISLDHNNLSGELPVALSSNLSLTNLVLENNSLSGNIPAEYGSLTNLQNISISNNPAMTGTLPMELTSLVNVNQFRYNVTGLCAPSDPGFQSWLTGIDDLGGLSINTNCPVVTPPTLASPADGSTVTTNTPTFSWNAVTGALAYEIVIDNDPEFGSPAQRFTVTSTEITLQEPIGNGTFYWRVRVKDSADYWSEWSAYRSLIVSVFNFTSCSAVSPIPQSECEALVTLYDATDGVNWTDNSGWLQTDLPCTWYGVTCTSGHVTGLALNFNNLYGPIPVELTNLTYLTTLSMYANDPYQEGIRGLTGSIPAELSQLSNLTSLSLWGNQVSGSIPDELTTLINLKYIDLTSNQISGTIPPDIGNLVSLINLDLGWNRLTGNIPKGISTISTLKFIGVQSNPSMSGTLPVELANMENLAAFGYADTGLCAPLDADFQAWLARTDWWEYLTQNTTCPLPSSPALTSPDDGSTVTTNTPTFSWNAVTDAVEYEFAIDDDAAFGSPAQLYTVTPTDTTVSTTLPEALPNGTFYWRVRVKDSAGYWSEWSAAWSVIVAVEGSISGIVTDASTGLPVQNIPVWVDRDDMSSYHTCTLEDGSYTFAGLELDREYRIDAVRMMDGNLCAGPDIYALQVFDGTINERSATMVPVTTADPVSTGINFALLPGGRISGQVLKSDGITPVAGVQIHLFTEIENGIDVFSWGETGHSDENGSFNFSGVPTGTYFVRTNAANEGGNLDLFDEWYAESGSTPDGSQANPVTITQGVNTTGVNFQLDTGGSISGHIYGPDGTTPLQNIPLILEGSDNQYVCTGSDGHYEFTGVALGEEWRVQAATIAADWCGAIVNYVQEYWDDQPNFETADTIILTTENLERANVDFILAEGGRISGVVMDAATEQPVANIPVSVDGPGISGGTCTDMNGYYEFTGLDTSIDWILRAVPLGDNWCENGPEIYAQQFYPDYHTEQDIPRIRLSDHGGSLSNADFALRPGGRISGVVLDEELNPIEGVHIGVYNNTDYEVYVAGGGDTDSQGLFSFAGVPVGSYYIHSDAPEHDPYLSLIDEWYAVGGSTPDGNQANPVTITQGVNTTGVNFQLDIGGEISGVVRNSNGDPLANMPVMLDARPFPPYMVGACTGSDGSYHINGLVLDTDYQVAAMPGWTICSDIPIGYIPQYWQNALYPEDATPVRPTEANKSLTNIDFSLSVGNTISGSIFDVLGNPLENIPIGIEGSPYGGGTCSAADGSYSLPGYEPGADLILVAAATWYEGCNGNEIGNFVMKFWEDVFSWSRATPIRFTGYGETLSGIDFTMEEGGSISGSVLDENDGPVQNFCVHIQDVNDEFTLGGCYDTDETGNFTINRLPAGEVYFRVSANGGDSDLVEEWYAPGASVSDFTYAGVVHISPNQMTSDINFQLDVGGTISGHVYKMGMTEPIVQQSICAIVEHEYDDYRCTNTDDSGFYQLRGLPARSDYKLRVDRGNVLRSFFPGVGRWEEAQSVSVQSGVETTGKDVYAYVPDSYITGRVIYDDSSPAPDVWMEAFHEDGWFIGSNTDENGNYTIPVIAGHWQVFPYQPPNNPEGQFVDVAQFETVEGVNFVLPRMGSISGHVYQADGVTPIANAYVSVGYYPNIQLVADLYTDESGAFSISVPPGEYYVAVAAEGYGWEYYEDGYDDLHITPVVVNPGEETAGIDMSLAPQATITGMVTDGTTGLEGVTIEVWPAAGGGVRSGQSSADGSFTVGNLTTGDYVAKAYLEGYVTEFYLDELGWETATTFTVTQPGYTPDINFTLEHGGTISGYVFGPEDIPLENIYVLLDGAVVGHGTCTDGSGHFEFPDVALGVDWRLRAGGFCEGMSPYSEEYWNDVYSYDQATPVTLTSVGEVRDDITINLDFAGAITGHIYDEDNYPVEGACINLFVNEYDWGYVNGWGSTDSDGAFSISGIPAGDYYVQTDAYCNGGNLDLANEIYGGVEGSVRDLHSATKVIVLAGETTSEINFWLDRAENKPYFLVYPLIDRVNGWEWLPGTDITLTIGDTSLTKPSDGDGFVEFEVNSPDIVPGLLVEMSDGETTKYHLVRDFAVTGFDQDLDTVTGTAVQNTRVSVGACNRSTCEWQQPYADEFGNWSTSFSGLLNIGTGSWGYVNQWELDGDATEIAWNIFSPEILVHPSTDIIEGWKWEPNLNIALAIGEYTNAVTSDENGYFNFDLTAEFDVQPGQLVELTDGTNSDDHMVRSIVLNPIDEENDIVSGTSTPPPPVGYQWTWVCNDGDCQGQEPIDDGGDGTWTADFSSFIPIGPGSEGGVWYGDDDGDGTQVDWRISNPFLSVNLNQDYVHTTGWDANATVALLVNGNLIDTRQTDNAGYYVFENVVIDPHDTVVVRDVDRLVEKVLSDVSFIGDETHYDMDAETLSGTADDGSVLKVMAHNSNCIDPNPEFVYATAEGGVWTANFAGICDLRPGSWGWVQIYDDDRDYTEIIWGIPTPRFAVNLNWDYIWGENWKSDSPFTIKVNDVVVKTGLVQPDGIIYQEDLDIPVGAVVSVSDSVSEKTHTVGDISLTDVNDAANTVSGTALAGSMVYADNRGMDPWGVDEQETNSSGNWMVTFSDISPGYWGIVRLDLDEDGDSTEVGWRLQEEAQPILSVNLNQDYVYTDFWDSYATISLYVDDVLIDTKLTDENGWLIFNDVDVQPRSTVMVRDGDGTEKVLEDVSEIGHDVIFDLGANTLSGTADDGSVLQVWAHDSDCIDPDNEFVYATSTGGAWTAEFDGVCTLQTGSWGYAQIYDGDGDYTEVYWGIPNPYISLILNTWASNPAQSQVNGLEWKPGLQVKLTVDDPSNGIGVDYTEFQNADSFGNVEFDLIDIEIVPGFTVVLDQGGLTRELTVMEIAVTQINQETAVITGTSEPGIWLSVSANTPPPDLTHLGNIQVLVDENGNWSADLASLTTMSTGVHGAIWYTDENRNSVIFPWSIEDRYILATLPDALGVSVLEGWDWYPGNPVTATVESDSGAEVYTGDVIADDQRTATFTLGDVQILPGYAITMTDGLFTEVLIAADVLITEINQIADSISGNAAPNRNVQVVACNGTTCTSRTVLADSGGLWSVSFASGTNPLDIQLTTTGNVWQVDGDNDRTILNWAVADLPVVTSTNPAFLVAGSPQTMITIKGENFDDPAVVKLNGLPRETTYDEPTGTLSILLSAAELAAPSNSVLTVTLPDVPGGISNTVWFSVIPVPSPAEGEKLAATKVTFTWGQIYDANLYGIQLSKSITFDPLVFETTTQNLTYAFGTSLTNGTTYYWRVRPCFGLTCTQWEDSPVWSFNSMNPPLAPALIAPETGTLTNINTPQFEWSTVENAVKYEIWVDDSTYFSSRAYEAIVTAEPGDTNLHTVGAGALSILPVDFSELADDTYYWRVRGIDSVGVAGVWSPYAKIQIDTTPPLAPTLSLPAASASVRGTPRYTWLAPGGAVAYQFEYNDSSVVDADGAFIDPLHLTAEELTTNTYTPPPQALGTYYWHVKARDAAGNWGSWSAPREVTIMPLIPLAPSLDIPLNNTLFNESNVDLTWKAAEAGVRYRVQVSTSYLFTSTAVDTTMGEGILTTTIYDLANNKYYWRVKALNIYGEEGPWSGYWSFTVDTSAPEKPKLYNPADGAFTRDTTPTLSVYTVPTAKYYFFQVAKGSDFEDPANIVAQSPEAGITTTSWTVPDEDALPYDDDYYWRAMVKDAAGNSSTWSDPRSFTVTFQNLPAAGLYTNDPTPTFSWYAVPGATGYRIEVREDSLTPVLPGYTSNVLGPLVTSNTPTIDQLLEPGRYLWKVVYLTESAPGESPERPLIIYDAKLNAPTLQAVSDNGYINTALPTLSWSPVENAAYYEIWVDNSTYFTSREYEAKVDVVNHTLGDLTSIHPDTMILPVAFAGLNDGKFYWRVRTYNEYDVPGAWSGYQSFTVDRLAPDVPRLYNPAVDGFTADTTPALSVYTAGGARYYHFQVSEFDDFSVIKAHTTYPGVTTTSWAAPLLDYGKYYWRVMTVDLAGNESPGWSEPRSFTLTFQNLPKYSAFIADTTPTFSWYGVTGATAYKLVIENDPASPAFYYESPELGALARSKTLLAAEELAYGKYEWHMEALVDGSWIASPARPLTITIPLAAPGLISVPNSGYTDSGTPELSWNPVENAAYYEVWVDNGTGFTSREYEAKVDIGNHTLGDVTSIHLDTTILPDGFTSLIDGKYYWRVRTYDIYDVPGPWSGYLSFTVDTDPPNIPNLYTPADSAFTNDTTPRLSVYAATGAKYYNFRVVNGSDCGSNILLESGDLTTTYWTVPADQALGYDEGYGWCAKATDLAGNTKGWSQTRSLTVTFQNLPKYAAFTTDTTPTLSWYGVTGAKSYELVIMDDPDFEDPGTVGYTSGILGSLVRSRTVSPSLAYGRYKWKVIAYADTTGTSELTQSPLRTLTITPPLLTAPGLSSPASGVVTYAATPPLSWNSVTGADYYEVWVDNGTAFTSREYEATVSTGTGEITHTLGSGAVSMLPVDFSALAPGRYYWRVRTYNVYGVPGAWSAYRSFTVSTAVPALSAPLDGMTFIGTPLYSWLAVTGAKAYQFEYAASADFLDVVYTSADISGSPYTPPEQSPGTYYWRVRAKDALGLYGGWSEARQVVITVP